jgi:hypothetical protein
VAHSSNVFAVESFLDEIAHEIGVEESLPGDALPKWIDLVLFLRHGLEQFLLIVENDRPAIQSFCFMDLTRIMIGSYNAQNEL